MAGYSARQSTFTSGDTITAAHSNDEFNQLLAAFNASTGHTHDGTAGDGGPVTTLRDSDALNKILVDTTNNHLEFYVEVSSTATQQLRIQDGAIVPITDNDIDLGTSSLEFKDLYVDGTAYVDAINFNGTAISATAAELNIMDGVTSTAAELNILDGVTSTATEINILDGDNSASTVTIVDADRIILNDNGTMKQVAVSALNTYTSASVAADDLSAGDAAINLTTSSGSITIDAAANDTDIIFKGTDNSADITMLTLDGSEAGKATFNSDVVVGGDLTVTGDDIIMGTNTAGNLLIADGTNFNSIAAGSLSEISTVANDDVFLAVDTSGGGLKKILRSTIVSGLATSSALSNVVEDTSPQLGANLDTNSHNILIDDAHFIADENGNEQIIFQTTSSAVNQFDITNAATSGAPKLSATGGDSNIDLEIEAKGTGHVTVRGNTNAGAIQFNCESNSHGQILKSQPHSAAVTNVMLLPDGADSTLVSLVATQTLTNKTLTSPVINSPTGDFIKIGGTSFDNSLIVGHATTGTLNDANRNVGVGIESLDAVTAGDDNTGVGYRSLSAITSGGTNTAIGNESMKDGTSPMRNSSLGYQSLKVVTGNNNIAIGYQAGDNITSGDGNIIIGNVDAGSATGDRQLLIAGYDGSTTTTWISGDSNGIVTFADDILIKDGGTIGSASDADAMTISSGGVVTFSQNPVFPDGGVDLIDIDIDGGTDIGADLTTSDLIVVDDGAGGTNRKAALSRVITLVNANIEDPTALAIALG